MSKLLLAAAPIETLIKAIRLSNRGGAGGPEDVVNSSYTSTSVEKNTTLRRGGGESCVDIGGGQPIVLGSLFNPLPSLLPPSSQLQRLSIPTGGC